MADIAETIARVLELDAEATKVPWKPSVGVYHDMEGDSEADDCFFGRGPVPFPHARALGEADAALIAYYRTAAPALANECQRLQACMAKAGLTAFMRDGDPEAVAEHLRSVIDSYKKPATECQRLRERVRVLEEALRPFAFAAGVFGDSQQVGVVMRDAPVTFHTTWRARAVNAPVLRGADFNVARAALAKGDR